MRRIVGAVLCSLMLAGTPIAAETSPAGWGRIELIESELFGVDASHSTVSFTIGFLGLTKIRGAFRDYTGVILFDERDPARSSARFVFDVASIETGMEVRDKDLKSPRFFEAEKYPKIVFQSRRIERAGKNGYVVHGTLKMHGVERAVSFPMTQTVPRMTDSAWGNLRIGGTGSVTLKRSDYGITGGEFWGQKALSDEVKIEIAILGNRFNFDKWSFDSRGKPSIGGEIWNVLTTGGAEAAVARYRELKQKSPDDYNFAVDQVTLVGNRLLQHRQLKEALAIFRLAAEEAPKETSVQARLGETCAAMGNREGAVAAYRKALELAPDNPEAIEMLPRLEKASGK